jgi:CO/xanthine dehydrogenase FAD-binding subunit
LLISLEWPRAPDDAGHAFAEIAQRHGDFAIAAAACQLRLDGNGRIATIVLGLGGVESRPRAVDVGPFIGQSIDEPLATQLAEHATRSLAAMQDHVATADYRVALARVLVRRVVLEAAADARQRRRPQ